MNKDNSTPYRTLSFERVEAPMKKTKGAPRGTKTVAKTDLRAGGKK